MSTQKYQLLLWEKGIKEIILCTPQSLFHTPIHATIAPNISF